MSHSLGFSERGSSLVHVAVGLDTSRGSSDQFFFHQQISLFGHNFTFLSDPLSFSPQKNIVT